MLTASSKSLEAVSFFMSPLIHKSLTWAIVGSVVLMSTWLANSVQDAHDQGGFRLRLAQQGAAPASGAEGHRAHATVPQAHIQVASAKR